MLEIDKENGELKDKHNLIGIYLGKNLPTQKEQLNYRRQLENLWIEHERNKELDNYKFKLERIKDNLVEFAIISDPE